MTRTRPRTDGSLALKLDVGGCPHDCRVPGSAGVLGFSWRLDVPDKYQVLEHRRRQAQIAARRVLEFTMEK